MHNMMLSEIKQGILERELLYQKINNEINNDWPEWKKKAYNEMFAISAHAKKVDV